MKKSSNILCIVNPNAAKGYGIKRAKEIKEGFEKKNQSVDILLTSQRNQAVLLAEQGALDGYEIIIAAGGDGTVNEVANGIMISHMPVKMGIIPIGRGNDFAWITNIPCDVDKAIDVILRSIPRYVDVGLLYGGNYPDGRYFINGAGFGFEPTVNFKASSYVNINGMASYLLAFLQCWFRLPTPYKLKLTIDGDEFELLSQQLSVCNGKRMGSAFIMGPNAKIDDGLLDAVYTNKPLGRFKILPLALSFFSGKQLKYSVMEERKVKKEIIIRSSEENMKIHVDGEEISQNSSICRITVIKNGICLYYPSK